MTSVFISYSHDDDLHQQRVYVLADRLIKDGVKVILDRDYKDGGPDEDWDNWSEKQAANAEIVLPVFTPEYLKCWSGDQAPGNRLGAILETKVIKRRIVESGSSIEFCRTVVFEADHRNCIPLSIKGIHTFDAQRDYAQILAWLRLKDAAPEPNTSTIELSWPKIPDDYPWPLADRVELFDSFKAVLGRSMPQRIFLIAGASNTGKTVLLNALFKLAKQVQLDAVLLDLKGCPSLEDLFDILALETNDSILPALHSAHGSARKIALLKDLETLKKPLLLGFDTYQHIAPDTADWLESQVLRRAEKCPGLLVLIAGQQVPEPAKYPWNDLALPNSLQPILEKHYWRDYAHQVLKSAHITDEHLDVMLHISKGDPGQTSALLQSFAGIKA
ncbi:toll/interleukin-1 receptor domain-containing protein [Methylomonas rivi]|uniref:TIR domain-containing protein n=1 Tax=Methylomonas rivi TaxID=2952226 RepID=A0ABT1UAP4_9GAMM|nr:TIR domain-containing protein [Methylomonas sp. WSC-6]MCQ8130935.1 TIR domain-containing protein [Methylomonas sp. WSC-6]